jgi:hypothetical protein
MEHPAAEFHAEMAHRNEKSPAFLRKAGLASTT